MSSAMRLLNHQKAKNPALDQATKTDRNRGNHPTPLIAPGYRLDRLGKPLQDCGRVGILYAENRNLQGSFAKPDLEFFDEDS
jgi:hypothetical protein